MLYILLVMKKLFAPILTIPSFLFGASLAWLPMQPAQAALTLFCSGLDADGYTFTATYVDGLFTDVRFDRDGSRPPVTSELTYEFVNEQGEPVYRGGYLGSADVILIDRSQGNVQPGSEVSVAVDGRWNQLKGVCDTTTPTNTSTASGLSCLGLDGVGSPYTATYVDGLFTKIRFDRGIGLPPVTSELTYDFVNDEGEPVYRGAYLGAADVVLIDHSKGNVQPGSEVTVAVDNNWNQQRGVCE